MSEKGRSACRAYTRLTAAPAGWAAVMKPNVLLIVLTAIAASAVAAAATASAPPVGRLPETRTTVTVKVTPDKLVSFTLPRSTVKGGVWRVARAYDNRVVQERSERRLKSGAVRITLEATGPGTTRVVYALTKGETPKAYVARVYEITVGDKPPPST